MNQNIKDRAFYARYIKSNECINCDKEKKPGFAFCYSCYKRLPSELQRGLYKGIGHGFEKEFEEAVKFLGG
jgi:hypothetical protein